MHIGKHFFSKKKKKKKRHGLCKGWNSLQKCEWREHSNPMKKILKWTGVVFSHPIQASLWAVDPYCRESIWTASNPNLQMYLYKTPMPKKKKKKKLFLLVSGWGCVLLFWDLKKGHPLVPAHLNFIYWCYCSSTFGCYSVNCAIYCCCCCFFCRR